MSQASATHQPGPFSPDFGWPAPAKLNLFLHVTGRRADGYHSLQTLFQFLDLADHIYFRPRGDGQIRLLSPLPDIPPETDLVYRAAQRLQQRSGVAIGAEIRVDKRIPLGAGLGGGSSNAATTLVALNRIWDLCLTPDELASIGLELGADVPVFVRGQAAWAEGVGERLAPVTLPEPWYVLLLPPVQVATGAIFAAPELRRDHPRITLADYQAGHAGNDCEPVTCARFPPVAAALDWLRGHGPARMSGTGACVFLDTGSGERGELRAREIAALAPAEHRSVVARGLNQSALAAIMRGL
jgi:4-diphosphocytidyl-2-C-methyl-D-erythritol kinase